MKFLIFLLFLFGCQQKQQSQIAKPNIDEGRTSIGASKTTSAPPPTNGEASTANAKPDAEKADESTENPEPTGVKIGDLQQVPATNQIPNKLGSEYATGDVFVGYDHTGKKGSLPTNCPLCKRRMTTAESQFIKKCLEQGGKTQSCNCITSLCSVKLK